MITPSDIFAANQVLTVAKARELKGKRIATTAPEYWMNRNKLNVFTVATIISEWEEAETIPINDHSPYSSYQEYWASYMNADRIDNMQNRLLLIDTSGHRQAIAHTKHDNWFEEPTFTGSDADREVYYIVLD